MSAITLILTDDGLAALTNPAHTGTSALTVTHVGLSKTAAGSIEAQKTLAVLPGEFKRLTTFGGEVMSPRVIHLSVRDESVDAYQLRSFALYLSNGVLAAVVSSNDPIMEKVPATTMVQSLDLAFSRDIEAELVFGDFTFVNPPATTDRLGVVELATVEETLAGVDSARVVTAFGLGRALLAWAQNFASRIHGHTVSEIDGLTTALQGKAASEHHHTADDITSGTFDIARIPAIAMGGITGLIDALSGKAAVNHQHAASDVTSGTFSIARIPALAMDKITGLVDALGSKADSAHQHVASDIISGVLAVGRIPALAMEKITGLANALALKADLAGATFTAAIRVRTGNQGAVELNSGSASRPGLVAFYTPDGVRRGYIGFASSDEGGELVLQGETNWIWRTSHRPKFGAATPWDSANLNPSAFAASDHTHDGLLIRQTYAPGTDLNTFTTSGIIGVHANPAASLNFPVIATGALEVFASAATRVYQRYTTSSTTAPDIYERSLAGTTWSPWRKVVMDDLASTYAARGLIEMATDAEAITGADQERAINPYILKRRVDARAASSAETIAGTLSDKFITPAALWSFAKSIGPSGYAQIPGTPIIMQWGSSSASLIEGQVTALLPIAFGGGCFFAAATPRNASSEPWADFMMQVVAKYLDRIIFFAQRGYDGRNTSSGFEWLALGFTTGTPNAVYSAGGGTGGGGGGGELYPEL